MRAIVVYESVFGNTRAIAEAIAAGLRAHLPAVELVEVAHAPTALDAVDLLVVGGPTHAWGMTRPSTREDARRQAEARHKVPVSAGPGIREWLEALAPRAGCRAAAFDTVVKTRFPTGSAAKGAAARLRKRGLELAAPPEHFYVTDTDGPLLDGELARATAWGAALSNTTGRGDDLAPRAFT